MMVLIEIQGTNCINLVYHRQFKVVDLMVVATVIMASDYSELGRYILRCL